MVGQAGERLGADDVGGPGLDQVHHLRGKKPSLPCLDADGGDRLGLLHKLRDGRVQGELAMGERERLLHHVPVFLRQETGQFAHGDGLEVLTQDPLVPCIGVHGLGHELHHAGDHGLAVLGLDHLDHVVVGVRLIFDQDLADHADPGLAGDAAQRQGVEGPDDPSA